MGKKTGARAIFLLRITLSGSFVKPRVYQQRDTCFTPGRGTERRLSHYFPPAIIMWTAGAFIALQPASEASQVERFPGFKGPDGAESNETEFSDEV